ncbi:hypothetical protein VPH35_067145 [Triticum aestivum]
METTAAVRNTSRRRANQLQVTVSSSCRSRPLPISVVACALLNILRLNIIVTVFFNPLFFFKKVQSSIGLEATGEQLHLCLLFSKYSRAECYPNSRSNHGFSSEGSEFYWVRNTYSLPACFRSSKSGVLDYLIYRVACAGLRSLPRWCPTTASVSLHPSSTPQGRQRYQVVALALQLHL